MKKAKRWLSVVLVFCLVMGLLPCSAMASEPGVQFAGGNGTEENPYQIATASQFSAIRNDVTAHYILTSDIDLSGITPWTPIGTESIPFSGLLDGNGHCITGISDFTLDPNQNTRFCALGLFGTVSDGGIIQNLSLKNIIIDDEGHGGEPDCYGIISGKLFNGTIRNCQVDGHITVSGDGVCIGGIVGNADSESATIEKCKSDTTILVSSTLGNCVMLYAGGIVGYSLNCNKIVGCYNEGNINVRYAYFPVSALGLQAGVGGITGYGRAKNSCNTAYSLYLQGSSSGTVAWAECGRISGSRYPNENCVSLSSTIVNGSPITSDSFTSMHGKDMAAIEEIEEWYARIVGPILPAPDDPTPPTKTSTFVQFLSGYNSAIQQLTFGDAYRANVDVYTLADSVDVSDMGRFLNKYVLVTAQQQEGNSLAYTITDIQPVTSAMGTVTAMGEHSLSIDGTEYPVREDWLLAASVGDEILYHTNNGTIMGYSALEEKHGILEGWDNTTKRVTIDGVEYPTNYLTDLTFLANLDQYLNHKITYTISGSGSYTPLIRIDDVTESESKIAVFSTEKSLTVKTGKSMWLGFGQIVDNQFVGDWKKMAIVVSNPTVISVSDYEETEYGYSLQITGKQQGATNVTITDSETGASATIVVTVQDSYAGTYSYAIDNMETFYPNNKWENEIQTNIYNLNGMYVNNYTCSKNGSTYTVSFDVYNSRYHTGAVDIYDADGNWINCEEIAKYQMISGLWDTGEQAVYLITDLTSGKLLTYEQASFSKHTSISFEVPDGGYFTISNNFAESPGTFLFNSCDILYDGVCTLIDAGLDEVKPSAFSGLIKETITEDKTLRETFIDIFKSTAEKEARAYAKRMINNQLDEAYSGISGQLENMLSSLDISWKHLFKTATGVGESAFTKLAGPAGIALKGCFAFSKGGNQLVQATHLAASVDASYATVYSSIDEGFINPHGVIVNTNGNIDAETELHVFRVSNNDSFEIILDGDQSAYLKKYELYNICFVKNDQLVQPSGQVTVRIPIPDDMEGDSCTVYRQEGDGNWSLLTARIEGNYLVFETNHFSLYSILGQLKKLSVASLPNQTTYHVGETLDIQGLSLSLGNDLIADGFICEPMVLSNIGTQIVTVRYGNTSAQFNVTVQKVEQAAPVAPELESKTYNSVTLKTIAPNANGAAAEYSKDGGATWQASPTFTGLAANTEYSFVARYVETENYKASPASTALKVTTDAASSGGGSTGGSSSGGGSSGGGSSFGGGSSGGSSATGSPSANVPAKWQNPYADVDENAWYYDAVKYVTENSLMSGYGNGKFGPVDALSRAQLAQILYNKEGKPQVGGSPFADVASTAWYAQAVSWAAEKDIVKGNDSGNFGPDDPVTREQLAVMLWRYAGSPASSRSLGNFSDGGETSSWAVGALEWAVEQGIVTGKGGGILDPQGQATRAEVAAMLQRYIQTAGK